MQTSAWKAKDLVFFFLFLLKFKNLAGLSTLLLVHNSIFGIYQTIVTVLTSTSASQTSLALPSALPGAAHPTVPSSVLVAKPSVVLYQMEIVTKAV